MPEERDRVIIEAATGDCVRRHWDWLKTLPRRLRLRTVEMIGGLVEDEYRRQEAATRSR